MNLPTPSQLRRGNDRLSVILNLFLCINGNSTFGGYLCNRHVPSYLNQFMAKKRSEKNSKVQSTFRIVSANLVEPEAERRVIAIAEIVKMLVDVICSCVR